MKEVLKFMNKKKIMNNILDLIRYSGKGYVRNQRKKLDRFGFLLNNLRM